jgi:hypothetical protein
MHGMYSRQCLLVLETAVRGIHMAVAYSVQQVSKGILPSYAGIDGLFTFPGARVFVGVCCPATWCLGFFPTRWPRGGGIARPVCALCRVHRQSCVVVWYD